MHQFEPKTGLSTFLCGLLWHILKPLLPGVLKFKKKKKKEDLRAQKEEENQTA